MPKEFLTVGELAKQMGTTVRTLQYYDREGLLKPSASSEGGRRLYSAKDIVRLHQILSFKYLGFSLDKIKSQLFTLDTPYEVAFALENQKRKIEEQIEELQKALQAVKVLYREVMDMKKVDFSKYAEIIEMLKVDDQCFWMWKSFEEPMKDHIRSRFGENSKTGREIFDTYKEIVEEAILLKRQGESPESEKSICLAKRWWDMVLSFTGGDMSLLSQLETFNQNKHGWDKAFADKQREIDDWVGMALQCYLNRKGEKADS